MASGSPGFGVVRAGFFDRLALDRQEVNQTGIFAGGHTRHGLSCLLFHAERCGYGFVWRTYTCSAHGSRAFKHPVHTSLLSIPGPSFPDAKSREGFGHSVVEVRSVGVVMRVPRCGCRKEVRGCPVGVLCVTCACRCGFGPACGTTVGRGLCYVWLPPVEYVVDAQMLLQVECLVRLGYGTLPRTVSESLRDDVGPAMRIAGPFFCFGSV